MRKGAMRGGRTIRHEAGDPGTDCVGIACEWAAFGRAHAVAPLKALRIRETR